MIRIENTITSNGKPVLIFPSPEDAQFWFSLMRQEAAIERAIADVQLQKYLS